MNSDLQDVRYLYRYGAFIGKDELETAAYLNTLPQDTILKMANTYVEGYCKGFELAGVDLSKKPLIEIRYCFGFERVIREAIAQFESMGHQIICYQPALDVMNRRPGARIGCCGSAANEQYDYDHQFDIALFLDHALKERKLSVYRTAYEKYADLAAGMAGPAVLETFGEALFVPINKKEAPALTVKQQKLLAKMQSECNNISYEFINGEERSFTIISFPIPAIGEKFEEIFNETIHLNTLDYGKYREIQEKLIDVLDKCTQLVVKGKESNETELTVQLHPLANPDKESIFENCLADVNIPLGEVFTSPILAGTNGLLHVSEVYIHGLCYRNLKIWVKDGMVCDYICDNFESEAENKALIRSNILGNYDSLPMGECAIGTNTVAYRMAKKYHIFQKLKILIAEKTGPHFAFGDTCYSNSEERRVYNPNGKEIIAKDNEISLLRNTDPQKAYFGCHTDITIPYDELDSIYGVTKDGEKLFIIQNGRFVVAGTEELNVPLDEIETMCE
jgi:leucyl aminopeptidase (aminopeptidase T)